MNNTKEEDDKISLSVWKCRRCGVFFYPKGDKYDCPRCGGKAAPSKDYDPDVHDLWEPEIKSECECPKCGTIMRLGYLVERNSLLQITTLLEGLYWTYDELGTIGTRIPLQAYACPECGYVEIKIRRLKEHKEKMLLAPTK